MKIDVLTLFPRMFDGVLQQSILKRAIEHGHMEVSFYDIRDFAQNKHRQVDDAPFGGGQGMLLMPQPAFDCLEAVLQGAKQHRRVVYMSPQGQPLTTQTAKRLSEYDELIVLCGHYEGIDQRVLDTFVEEEISLGDFILTGGEIAAMALIDTVARFVPGVLGSAASAHEDSFSDGLLEYPQYTRPSEFRGMKVPEVLLSGDHQKIAAWRRKESLRVTKQKRPDLLQTAALTKQERETFCTLAEQREDML